jgi:endonuclease V-like protein UPF0215 family
VQGKNGEQVNSAMADIKVYLDGDDTPEGMVLANYINVTRRKRAQWMILDLRLTALFNFCSLN